ncbi:hypothetical protein [uncultured Shewanella sp.]|uniref:hypothetical protein n=1 Tax=uncultured Shewanella sp. TaxID=173975 RepID=UPI002625E0FF|nr:hypothetical protein [uncultured Shewanella sp.]
MFVEKGSRQAKVKKGSSSTNSVKTEIRRRIEIIMELRELKSEFGYINIEEPQALFIDKPDS